MIKLQLYLSFVFISNNFFSSTLLGNILGNTGVAEIIIQYNSYFLLLLLLIKKNKFQRCKFQQFPNLLRQTYLGGEGRPNITFIYLCFFLIKVLNSGIYIIKTK